LHVVILEPAFPRLVTDGAVQRVIDQEELHDTPSSLQDLRALCLDHHSVSDPGIAGDLELGHLFDLHQTHAAVAGNGELWVIAVVGDIDSRL